MRVLVTGVAGFIGMHVAKYLLARGDQVIGVDNLSDYYSVDLKIARLGELDHHPDFTFWQFDLSEKTEADEIFKQEKIDRVVHLAAQPGVRYSLENPHAYVDSNITGFLNVLENCRYHQVAHLVYASSSSVYGGNVKTPFSENDPVDHPVSLYAATKKSNELMAHVYSHLFNVPTTGLRFFTVYGPWSRPDMAMLKFAEAIYAGKPIDVYNDGNLWRDFTYIDDIVKALVAVLDKGPVAQKNIDKNHLAPSSSWAPYRVFNIGHAEPVLVNDMIGLLENALGKKAIRNNLPKQLGDVDYTHCDNHQLSEAVGFSADISLEEGVGRFARWFLSDYQKIQQQALDS